MGSQRGAHEKGPKRQEKGRRRIKGLRIPRRAAVDARQSSSGLVLGFSRSTRREGEMQTEARVGVVVEDSRQRALSSGHGDGGVGDGKRRYSTQQQSQAPRQQLQHQPQIGTVEHLIAGGVAGAVSKTCTAPLARLTILFQVQGMHSDAASLGKASIWKEASRIVSEEGFRAFWKGNLVTIAHRLPYSSISFYAYEQYKSLLKMIPGLDKHRDNVAADICVRLFAGGLAGITAASLTYPLDLVRTRLAAQVIP
ncbi:uncharacterized protein LOC141823736 [Curcuma longa]|uniref:uncharacterized protein LOC141823736 n=1 Tax=Curcuma longa TaxID=136217 RepID=UPI003D9E07DF